jgi:hypothetical protein
VSDFILTAAARIATEWIPLAAAWHIAAAALALSLWWPGLDGRAIATLLSVMPVSVAAMAAWSGNPFNLAVFAAMGLVMIALAGTSVSSRVTLAGGRDAAAGLIMCGFGWVYPHFLDGPAWQYLYGAPLGLLPCPTLAFLIGVSLLANSFDSKPWTILMSSVGLIYGAIGVFILRVTIDWFLIAGAAILLSRAATPLSVGGLVTLHREKRQL